jgi:hypothetical protein
MSFMTTKAVALKTGLSADAVRWNERCGRLLAIKVEDGRGHYQRLFLAEDVERFMKLRAQNALPPEEAAAKSRKASHKVPAETSVR